MKVSSASLRRVVASGLIFAFTILPLPSAMAQGTATASEGISPLPDSPIEKAQKDGTALPLSLTEYTKMVLQNNLDIAISDTNEENRRLSLATAHTTYDPTLSATASTGSRRSVSNQATDSTGAGGSINKSDSINWNFQFRKQFSFAGGSLNSSLQTNRNNNNNINTIFNPSYGSSLQVSYTQPLLRNLRIDSNRNQIRLANLDIEQNEVQFKQSVTTQIANAQSRYWDLVSAIRNYDIQRKSVELAQINLRDQQKRLEVGTVPPIDVTTARATVTQRELNVISAEDQILQAQNNLRTLVSSDRNSDIWKKVIVPTDQPDFREYKIDSDTAVAIALQNRPEIEQSRISVTRLNMQNQVNLENRKWGVDLTASFTASGTAGPQGCFTQFGVCQHDSAGNEIPAIKPGMVGGIPTVYKTIFTDPGTNWQISVNVSVPLWNRRTDIQIAQNEISKRQELMRRRQTEQNIQVEVLNALQSLESSRRQVDAAEVSRKVAEEQLDGEVKRNEAGLSQNYRVLEVQQQLSNQEYSELQALIRYKQAIITLQRVMYNLLEASDFSVAKGSSLNIPTLY